jgi:hypothetical protein
MGGKFTFRNNEDMIFIIAYAENSEVAWQMLKTQVTRPSTWSMV